MSLKNFHFRVFLNLSLTSLLKYYFIFFDVSSVALMKNTKSNFTNVVSFNFCFKSLSKTIGEKNNATGWVRKAKANNNLFNLPLMAHATKRYIIKLLAKHCLIK